jgi:hypothetical protein
MSQYTTYEEFDHERLAEEAYHLAVELRKDYCEEAQDQGFSPDDLAGSPLRYQRKVLTEGAPTVELPTKG